jgi:hypothetical protein
VIESYTSNREQQVIIKETISLKGNLKALVPQVSTLASLVVFIFINDIADDMLGLCRLFADDTSVGERALEINNLRSMVNIDLNNITHWAKQWLVKLKIQILHMMSTAHFLQLFTNTYRTLKDLVDVYVLLTHLRSTTQHQSQYILQYYVIFLT